MGNDSLQGESVQFIGTVPRRMLVTTNGRSHMIDLTAEETEAVLAARQEAEEEVGSRILGARHAARAAA